MKNESLKEKSLSMRIVSVAFGCACVLCACCFLFVSWQSLLDTCWYDGGEHTAFYTTNLPMQLALIGLWAAALGSIVWLVHRWKLTRFVLPSVLLCTMVVGTIWIWAANAAQVGESALCSNVAMGAAQGNWYAFRQGEYMSMFPFQSGFVAYLETLYAVFGQGNTVAVNFVGLGWILVGQASLYFLAGRISQYPQAKTITALLAFVTWPWILYVTFNYGTLPALSLALCGCLSLLRFLDKMQTPSKRTFWHMILAFVPTILLFAGAMLLKNATLIVLIAACLVVLLHAIQQKDWRLVACPVLLCVFVSGATEGVRAWYEARSGCELGSGTPKLVWISMGLEEGPMAMGWYNGKTYSALADAKQQVDTCNAQQLADIAARLAEFSSNQEYTKSFFKQKINSQWINPSFGSINFNQSSQWSSASRWPALTQYICNRTKDSITIRLTDALQTLVYAAGALGLIAVALRKRTGECIQFGTHANGALLAITVLGGFLYLLISEGKSQYALSYYILLLPYAAHGLCVAWRAMVRTFDAYNAAKLRA